MAAKTATPKSKSKPGAPRQAALRWTINQAAREFGVHREQLERRRRALGIEAGEDGCFTSQEIGRMLFGDKEAETIGKLAAERKKIEIEIEGLLRQRIPLEIFNRTLEQCHGGVCNVIKQSRLSELEKEEIFTLIRDVPSQLKW